MVIAVDTRGTKDYRDFIFKSFSIITTHHPEHSFFFISDEELNDQITSAENITRIVAEKSKFSLLEKFKIASLLKNHKADIFITSKLNSQVSMPQCLIANDKFTPGSLKKAKVIITGAEFLKKQMVSQKADRSVIRVVYKGYDEFSRILSADEKEILKASYSDGYEYFLSPYTGEITMMNVLKAFSAFKKMQKSGMHLLIISNTPLPVEFMEKLKRFKYSREVQVVNEPDDSEMNAVIGAAYAYIDPSQGKDYKYALNAMRSMVPVIAGADSIIYEIVGESGLYFNENAAAAIADKMMQVFKDEKLRERLIQEGNERSKSFSWAHTAEGLWKGIEKACR